ncbi:monosaccharide ABC transporter substrate-binding protein (CUT2 family) [Rhizobium sp. PP-F2F-G38]|uniref:Substrate-binding domain-containing protein n=1 Tax=Ferranicluibacter rubi TaxID=2715133 RepID=A0AA43ZG63_9HYPH|nr:substrate-binding domain-containing protein [Ferranicluibacter rubi]NHT77290.1 substrate-binding domain-containing protein [Ferranicluibacter rubi]PYE34116.1 monosaccharide ABC transporter substrate-binding protein (CUT2 family) [Rhizobium sp. PP-WC-1G-195]PYE96752.1 monosaccharide ABC transporter substrate-binding protein (CUT2 family) [Rhizobium sp. PP-F2F-G38]TCQ23563.1 monosaccharide ABC transporter substrate-binding protein (CUT2 family) [Rhizobium sp. PP-CC-3G-465]
MKMRINGLLAATALVLSAHATQAQDAVATVVAGLPEPLKAQYEGAPQAVLPSAWEGFTAPAKPWKWCHSESYQGNPWRVTVTKELQRLVEGLIANGTVASFEVSDSNNDVSQQINQIRAFVDKGCSIITSIPGSATALDDAIDAAAKAGIPFVTAAGSVTSPTAINVDSNYARWGYDMMSAVGKALPDGGSVLLVEGIAGHPIVVQERQGGDKALAENTKLKVARNVNGNWTANVTKTVVFQAIATNPAPIDAVWTTGSESRVVAEAFAEAGRPAPLITGSLTGDALGYWKANPDKFRFEGHALLPHWTAQTLFRVGARMLDGQKPKLNTLMIPIPAIHNADLPNWYKDCMMPDSVSVFPVPPQDPMPEPLLDAYFTGAKPTPGWDYASTPDACAK